MGMDQTYRFVAPEPGADAVRAHRVLRGRRARLRRHAQPAPPSLLRRAAAARYALRTLPLIYAHALAAPPKRRPRPPPSRMIDLARTIVHGLLSASSSARSRSSRTAARPSSPAASPARRRRVVVHSPARVAAAAQGLVRARRVLRPRPVGLQRPDRADPRRRAQHVRARRLAPPPHPAARAVPAAALGAQHRAPVQAGHLARTTTSATTSTS